MGAVAARGRKPTSADVGKKAHQVRHGNVRGALLQHLLDDRVMHLFWCEDLVGMLLFLCKPKDFQNLLAANRFQGAGEMGNMERARWEKVKLGWLKVRGEGMGKRHGKKERRKKKRMVLHDAGLADRSPFTLVLQR